MPDTRRTDDLAPEEIGDVEEFYSSDDGKVTFKDADDFIRWLHDSDEK